MYTLAQIIAENDQWGHMGGWGGGSMWLWGTLMMLFWMAIIAGAIWLFARGRDQLPDGGTTRARDILDDRYARGELTTEEYSERLVQLSSNSRPLPKETLK